MYIVLRKKEGAKRFVPQTLSGRSVKSHLDAGKFDSLEEAEARRALWANHNHGEFKVKEI